MSGYRVDEEALRGVGRALDRGASAVAAARESVDSVATTGLGTDALDEVAGALVARWSAGLSDVAGCVADASSGVRRCLADYTDAEQRITDLFRDPG